CACTGATGGNKRGPPSVVLALNRTAWKVIAFGQFGRAVFPRALRSTLQQFFRLVVRQHVRVLGPHRVHRRDLLHVEVIVGNYVAEGVRPVLPVEGGRHQVTLDHQLLRGYVGEDDVRHVAVVATPVDVNGLRV